MQLEVGCAKREKYADKRHSRRCKLHLVVCALSFQKLRRSHDMFNGMQGNEKYWDVNMWFQYNFRRRCCCFRFEIFETDNVNAHTQPSRSLSVLILRPFAMSEWCFCSSDWCPKLVRISWKINVQKKKITLLLLIRASNRAIR